eukprot:661774-Rhodomonas_salina.2
MAADEDKGRLFGALVECKALSLLDLKCNRLKDGGAKALKAAGGGACGVESFDASQSECEQHQG